MFCTACGTRNAEISNFCKQCGHKLDRASSRISEEAFDRALPQEEQVSALLERAYRLRKSGELSAAVRLCEEALHLNPESTSVHSLLGQIHEQTGNRDAALHEYERVLQLNPGSIADRVKLDELRGDGLPAPLHPRTAPHIVMPNHSQSTLSLSNPNGRQMLGIAGICGALMVMGGLIALQFFAHQDKNGNTTGSPRNNTRIASAGPQTDSSTGTGASAPTNGTNPTAAPTNIAPTSPSGLQIYGGPQGYSQPVFYVNQPPPVVIRERATSSAPARTNGGLPNMENLHPQVAGDNADDRVRLPDGADKQYSITIRPHTDAGDTTSSSNDKNGTQPKGVTTPPKTQGVAANPKGNIPSSPLTVDPGTIRIHTPKENAGPGAPTTEALSQMAIASDKFKAADYDAAIRNYQRALSGAGSQTAYVYMQMGICFQRIKNKASAISNFSNAIAEYHKLESANQQLDLARVGIKVCENGIKLCNAE